MIKLNHVEKYYKSGNEKYHALKDIQLTFPDIGLIYIVGKSGSGKSTLLNILGGLDSYDSGEIYYDNLCTKNFKEKDYQALRNSYIGFIFQEFNVIKSLTVYENVALSIDLLGQSTKEKHDWIMQTLDDVGLKNKAKRNMNELSGGERQRVAIARALVKKPKVIIADEPTGNLDSKNRDIVMNLLKKLSLNHLVIVVTHDKHLSYKFGDREITIKDGAIIQDEMIHPEDMITAEDEQLTIEPITPKLKTSIHLAWNSFVKHKVRFILIILLFSVSLLFAGSVINLYKVDSCKEYANYQNDYNNFVIDIGQNYNSYNITTNSSFFTNELEKYQNKYKEMTNNQLSMFTTIPYSINIHNNADVTSYDTSFYQSNIQSIVRYDSIDSLQKVSTRQIYEGDGTLERKTYMCYITDYLAQSLIKQNYWGTSTPSITKETLGLSISCDGCHTPIYIKGLIYTNYSSFQNKDFTDSKILGAFTDNLKFYNALFLENSTFESYFSSTNIDSVTDNLIYSGMGEVGNVDNITYTRVHSSIKYLNGVAPIAPIEGKPYQIAISKSLYQKCFKRDPASASYCQIKNESGTVIGTGGIVNYGNFEANFYFCGTKRVPTPISVIITGIIDSDEDTLYMPQSTPYFGQYLSSSFYQGGTLLIIPTNDTITNSEIYSDMLKENISINNDSFKKIRLVSEFIRDNLIIFAGLFFTFGLFSILMIFNFVIITIKNSTHDIGIYLSLGMNGFKIACIYFFQVLLIGIISFIISSIGIFTFLRILDNAFSSQALIDFKIIKFTPIGVVLTLLISILVPIISVIFPLIRLCRKKPVDILKLS